MTQFTAERARHQGFIGRSALLAQLDQWLLADDGDRWVVVTGGPGMGKSALLAAWLARREAAGERVPHHFIHRGQYDWDDPTKLVASLIAQLARRFPSSKEAEGDAQRLPAARLAAMLERVSARKLAPRGRRMVVLIDGLDEYDPPTARPGADPLAAFLPYTLPRGVSVLCSSRPRHPYMDRLAARQGELRHLDLDDAACAADHEATVRAFWEREAPQLGLDAKFVAAAVECADGNLQHAATLRKHLNELPQDRRRVELIPRGLVALLDSTWERIATEPTVVDGLGILCAAREALTLDELGAVAGWTAEAQRRAFVRSAGALLVEGQRAGIQPEYRLHHDSIRAHVAAAIGAAALRAHHRALAQRLATWPAPKEAIARRYALRHALLHRVEAGEWADAWRLASDLSFLEVKGRELGAHEAEADVARAAERCRGSGDEPRRQRFEDLARVLGREARWLRKAPEATAALVWNGLRQWAWSPEAIDQQLQLPGGARFLRLRHLVTRERPALVRSLVGHTGAVTACAVTPDSRRLVSASEDQTLTIWDLDSGGLLASLHGHAGPVTACAITPDGRRLVSASEDQTLKVWDLDAGRLLTSLHGHTLAVTACAITPDGRRLVSASQDRTLKVWDLDAGRLLADLEGHRDVVCACAVTPDGRRVVSASWDATLKVWDLDAGGLLADLEDRNRYMTACAVSPDGRRLVFASYDAMLKVRDLDAGHLFADLEGHRDVVSACVATPDGGRVVSASWDQTIKVWDLDTGGLLSSLHGHTLRVNACAVTPDGRRLVSASWDQTLKIWDLDTGERLASLEGHTDAVTACAVTPDGRRLVSASWDQTLKVWDLDTGGLLSSLEGHTASVTACAVSRDGRRLVSASLDETLKVWDLDTGETLASLHGHTGPVTACAVTPDGGRVVSASQDETLKVWDLDAGRLLATLHGHTLAVTACAVTTDGRRLVSASEDRTLKVWDLESGACLFTHRGDAGFHAVATTASTLIAGDAAGAVWFLDWPS